MVFGIAIIWMRDRIVHFEILVEDQSGKKALDILVPKIVGAGHTATVHCYKGIGRIPSKLSGTSDPGKRILLNQLPRLLQGYGKTYAGYSDGYDAAVILVCDLDKRCLKTFRSELLAILENCNPKPVARFCIAIEEGEAWLLGDILAIQAAYPKAKSSVLDAYVNDSICGTWEKLADAVYPGGAAKLSAQNWQVIGTEKSKWAEAIAPRMNVNSNLSPSFCYFRDKLSELSHYVVTPIQDAKRPRLRSRSLN